MTVSYYNLYVDSVVQLARSLVIKDTTTAEFINKGLSLFGHRVDVNSPHTWKYYLNLSGQYHQTDEVMYVTSLDTLEQIRFDVTTLDVHRVTKRAYGIGSRYYNDLLKRYPKQEALIKGILSPVNINVAVQAKDHTILHHNSNLVENNETDLLNKIQRWVDDYFLRWDNEGYDMADNLYPAAVIGTLFAHLPNAIMNIRLDNCKTERAHSFHVWSYLESRAQLREYRDYLTTSQALFLYRNIDYIQEHAGKAGTFNLLVEKFLTERGIPLYGYKLKQDVSTLVDTLEAQVVAERELLNPELTGSEFREIVDLDYVIGKQVPLARRNMDVLYGHRQKLIDDFRCAKRNTLPTKLMESVVTNTDDLEMVGLEDILFNQWLTLSHKGDYNTFLQVPNPHSGNVMVLSPMDAFTLFIYVMNISIGCELTNLPMAKAIHVLRDPSPTREELLELVDNNIPAMVKAVSVVLDTIPASRVCRNLDDFSELGEDVYRCYRRLRGYHEAQELMHRHAMASSLSRAVFQEQVIYLGDYEDQTFASWLNAREIDVEGITVEDAADLANTLMELATGISDEDGGFIMRLQQSMVNIILRLCSYDCQIVNTVNGNNTTDVRKAPLRVGEVLSYVEQGAPALSVAINHVVPKSHETRNYSVLKNHFADIAADISIPPNAITVDLVTNFESFSSSVQPAAAALATIQFEEINR